MPNHYQSLLLSLTQKATEQEWLEFKLNFHSPDEIGKRISALANGACLAGKKFGYLIFGVEDGTHNIVGTSFSPKTKKS